MLLWGAPSSPQAGASRSCLHVLLSGLRFRTMRLGPRIYHDSVANLHKGQEVVWAVLFLRAGDWRSAVHYLRDQQVEECAVSQLLVDHSDSERSS